LLIRKLEKGVSEFGHPSLAFISKKIAGGAEEAKVIAEKIVGGAEEAKVIAEKIACSAETLRLNAEIPFYIKPTL
jgi:hypothetical protein